MRRCTSVLSPQFGGFPPLCCDDLRKSCYRRVLAQAAYGRRAELKTSTYEPKTHSRVW
jgi:hypothetical protein